MRMMRGLDGWIPACAGMTRLRQGYGGQTSIST